MPENDQLMLSSVAIEYPLGTEAGPRRISRSQPALEYWLYRPRAYSRCRRVLVAVHGVSRNAQEHIELLRGYADRCGVMLVAPLFAAEVFRDYQRLGRTGIGPRADLALIRLLNEIGRETGIDTSKVDIFGFSGGAQFAHRFAYAHSQRVRRIVLGSAGWYTMPDASLPYPYGTSNATGLAAVRLNTLAAARLPTLVAVGEDDDREDDEELNRSRIVLKSQGRHRVERARAWTSAMNALAERHGASGSISMVKLPRVGHSFRQAVVDGGLARLLFDHCYAEQQGPGSVPFANCDAAEPADGRSDQNNRGSRLK